MSIDTLGMTIFLCSLGVVFIASLIAYFWERATAAMWRDASMPPLPRGLWLSTAVIIAASVAVQKALVAVRRNDQALLKKSLVMTLVAGLSFLGLQALSWSQLIAANLPPNARSLY